MLAMKYLPNVSKGDKRIVVANGKIMLSTIRYPSRDSWLCNIAQGGVSKMAQPSPNERKIAHTLSPVLKNFGVILYGFDTLVNNRGKRILSEINTLSIGGIKPAEVESGRKIAPTIAQRIINHLNQMDT
jgi:glutathione synthase